MKYGWILVLSLLNFNTLQGQKSVKIADIPDLFEYHQVDVKAVALNQHLVRKSIGYPSKAIKDGIEGKVFCRVLVDEKGHYVRHELTRVDHPLLGKAVDPKVHYLKFSPAFIKRNPVSTWTNVVFSFKKEHQRYEFDQINLEPRMTRRLNNPYKRAEYYLTEGQVSLDEGNYRSAVRMLSQVIAIGKERSKKIAFKEISFSTLIIRSEVYTKQGQLDLAIKDLTEAIGLAQTTLQKEQEIQSNLPNLYKDRAELYLMFEKPYEALEDLQWVERVFEDSSFFISCQISEVYLQIDQLEPAEQRLLKLRHILEKDSQSQPEELHSYHSLLYGVLQMKKEEYESSFAALQSSIEHKVKNPLAYFYKAMAIWELEGDLHVCENLQIAIELGLGGKRKVKAEQLIEELGCYREISLK
ncbi:MAG: energy transducer TonB [Bacteroidota bacterium]